MKNKPKRKAEFGGIRNGSANSLNSKSQKVDAFYFRRIGSFNQCRKCGSDYLLFATKDRVCLDCQQHAEFIFREQQHPNTNVTISFDLEGGKQ